MWLRLTALMIGRNFHYKSQPRYIFQKMATFIRLTNLEDRSDISINLFWVQEKNDWSAVGSRYSPVVSVRNNTPMALRL